MNIIINILQSALAQQETVLIPVYLDTQNIAANAVEGSIVFPKNLLDVQEVYDGNSRINFWVQSPTVQGDTISFSGITPGGFSGSKELLFTIQARTTSLVGTGELVTNINAFENDGLGTRTLVRDVRVPISVTEQVASDSANEYLDTVSPESFTPIIGRDDQLFDGQYFLVFSTQDKGVGIDHYQVREGFFAKYHEATSPTVLADQGLHTKIFVKAIDYAGNVRVEKISGNTNMTPYIIVGFIAILISGIIIRLIYKKLWRKSIR